MDRPFRFLDLPKELRLMVYELLCVSEKNHPLVYVRSDHRGSPVGARNQGGAVDPESQASSLRDRPCITLVTCVLDVQILATCRQIRAEATHFVHPKLEWIKSQIPRVQIDADCSCELLSRTLPHLICALLGYLHAHCTAAILGGQVPNNPPEIVCLEPALRWVDQTAVRLLAQLHSVASLLGDSSSPEVRLLLEIHRTIHLAPQIQGIAEAGALAGLASAHPHRVIPSRPRAFEASSPSKCTLNATALLAQAFNDTFQMARARGLDLVRGGSLVFGQRREEILRTGFVEIQTCMLGYHILR
jgi:hypothetical protein